MPTGIFSLGAVGGQKKKERSETEPRKDTKKTTTDTNQGKPKLAPKNQGRFRYNDYKIKENEEGRPGVTYEEFQEGHR